MLHDFAMHLHQAANASDQQPIDQALANEVFDAYLVRQLAFNSGPGYFNPLNDVDPEDRPTLPSREAADARLLAVQDKLTRRYRASRFKQPDAFSHTMRIPVPVGYAGGNKIICIIEEARLMYNEPKGPLKLWYGQPPDDYLRQYRERIGGMPGLINARTGEELLPADPER
jgi:hypothetical protein